MVKPIYVIWPLYMYFGIASYASYTNEDGYSHIKINITQFMEFTQYKKDYNYKIYNFDNWMGIL